MTDSQPVRKLSTSSVDAAIEAALAAGELGLQVAAYIDGELVIDTWAGTRDAAGRGAVEARTLFPVFSVTKAFTAVAVHVLAERGQLDYGAPLARYWPEYGCAGKEGITVRQVLIHRAGVPQMPEEVTPELMTDWSWITGALAKLSPVCAPGTRNTYMGYTYGFLLGEAVRRADPLGRPFGDFLREEVCQPLGIDDFWVGLPDEERGRVATLVYPDPGPLSPSGSMHARSAPAQVAFRPEVYNRADVQRACIPAANGIGTAREVARLFAMLAGGGELNGTRLLWEATVRSFLEPRPGGDEHDLTFGAVMPIGMGGLLRNPVGYVRTDLGAPVLCQFGAGGSLGYADLRTGLAFAICHNRMFAKPPPDTTGGPFIQLGDALRSLAA